MKKINALALLCFLPMLTALGQQKQVSERELPAAVVQSLQRNFQDYAIGQVVRVERPEGGSGFRVRVQKKEGAWDVELDTRGQVRERVVVVERHEDDDHHEHKHKHKHEDKHKHKHKDHCHHHKHDCEKHHHHKHDDHDDCDHHDD